jgi:cytochrome b pre-mRNA-processing protein 3
LVGLAKLLGYNLPSSLAIRASRDLYTHCALAAENKAFYVDVCGLPDNFHTWFAITQLHVWMLMVRLRPEKHGKAYTQELVNRFFEDVEERIRSHGIIQDRIVAATVKDHLMAFRGGVLAYDEGMCKTDAVLAAALWRNVCRDTPFDKELAYLVRHVRHQLVALDRWPSERLLRGDIKFMTPVAQF